MGWFGFVKGDINRAKILTDFPDTSKTSDFCVIFDGKLFDPLGQRNIDVQLSRPVYFNRLLLLLSFPSCDTISSFTLKLVINKSMPICPECDGGCAKFKESQIDTIFTHVVIEPGNRTRKLFDLFEYIKDWHILDFTVTAILFENENILAKSSISSGGWPWCQ